jgi:hypothetical protein
VTVPTVLAPLFVQVALTFALLIWTGRARFAAARAGEVKIQDIALGQRAWPAAVQQVSNTFQNQLELPVLFYVLVTLALFARKADLLFVLMAWLFVISRFGHAYAYVTSNHVLTRFRIFLVGAIILMAMWLIFAVRVLLGG